MYIDERKPEGRREIIEFLEKNGYNRDNTEFRSKEEIIEAYLPIVIFFDTKEYRMMGNVTCAAAAASSKRLITKEEFYRYFHEREGGKQMGEFQVEKIYFDMDGVLADFGKGVRDLCHMEAPSPDGPEDPEKDNEMWRRIKNVEHFYDKLDLMPGAKELFDAVYNKYGDKCEILTGIPKPHRGIKDAGEDKEKWVHRLLAPEIEVNVCLRAEKIQKCNGKDCILIDDMEKNIKEWTEEGGTGIQNLDAASTMKKLKEMGIL